MAEAVYYKDECAADITAAAAYDAGQVVQLPNGMAGVYPSDVASGDLGHPATEGVFTMLKTASIAILDGGRVFWDHSANTATYKPVNDKDFYLGTAVGDAAESDTTVKVNLNVRQACEIDVVRDAVLSVPTGTAAAGGFGYPVQLGGAFQLSLTATSEAQCIDMLSVDRRAVGSNPIVEAVVRIPTNGSTSAVDFNIGLANGTSTTDADAVTEHVFFHVDGGDTKIYAQSKDGTTTVTATDTTKTISAGSAVANRSELWIDARDPASVKLYVDGVRVLSGSTFVLTNASGPLGVLAHLEKTTGTATGIVVIDRLVCRTAEQ